MDDTVTSILTGLGGLLGGAGGVLLLNLYKAWKESKNLEIKQVSDIKLTENEQAVKIYRDLLEGLKEDVNRISKDMDKLEKDYLKSREENAMLKADLRANAKEIEYYKSKINLGVPSG